MTSSLVILRALRFELICLQLTISFIVNDAHMMAASRVLRISLNCSSF